jgi:two-component system OmpR family response regulator
VTVRPTTGLRLTDVDDLTDSSGNDQLTTVPSRKTAAIAAAAWRQKTILIVDDDEGVAQTFARMLKLEGYTVRTAISGEIGLQAAAAFRPDAIILDFRMPLVDGLEFMRQLRAAEQSGATPVAIVTGDYFLDDMVSAELKALGAQIEFKPLWLEDLVDLTRGLLQPN